MEVNEKQRCSIQTQRYSHKHASVNIGHQRSVVWSTVTCIVNVVFCIHHQNTFYLILQLIVLNTNNLWFISSIFHDLMTFNIQAICYGKKSFIFFRSLACQRNSSILRLSRQLKAAHSHPPTYTSFPPLILTISLLCVRQMRQWDNNGAQRHMSES